MLAKIVHYSPRHTGTSACNRPVGRDLLPTSNSESTKDYPGAQASDDWKRVTCKACAKNRS